MDNINELTMAEYKKNETATKHTATFLSLVYAYSIMKQNNEDIEDVKEKLLLTVMNEMFLPLPSGKVGNELALLIEMHEYVGAMFLLKHKDDLDIDLNCIAKTSFFSNDKTSLKEEFVVSLITYEDKSEQVLSKDEKKFELENLKAIDKIREYIDQNENKKYK